VYDEAQTPKDGTTSSPLSGLRLDAGASIRLPWVPALRLGALWVIGRIGGQAVRRLENRPSYHSP